MDYLDIARQIMARHQAETRPAPAPDPAEALERVLKGQAIAMFCDLVAETIWLVADEEDAAELVRQGERRGSIYSAAEIRAVAVVDDPEVVRDVHRLKRTFDSGRLSKE